MKFLIHACPDRIWYVDEFLVPSMLEQGIPLEDITVWNDVDRKGCLQSCMDAFKWCGTDGGTWHLQDDVIISSDFAQRTRDYDDGVVCGFVNEIFGPDASITGSVPACFMWNSFQCIRIPNHIAGECAEWVETEAPKNPKYQGWIAANKFDDSLFAIFFKEKYADMRVVNLKPNIVDHVDYLIGGSVVNRWRGHAARSAYWEDNELVDALKANIEKLAH